MSTLSEGTKSRDLSPEALRRFLVDDNAYTPDSRLSEKPALIIPEDIAEEIEDVGIEDPRVVGLLIGWVRDWERGARGEMDMWSVAETIVERRLSSQTGTTA